MGPVPVPPAQVSFLTSEPPGKSQQCHIFICKYASVLISGKKYKEVKKFGGFPGDSAVKNPPDNAGDAGLIPASGRSPGGGNGNPL